jgi:hypothetical protein
LAIQAIAGGIRSLAQASATASGDFSIAIINTWPTYRNVASARFAISNGSVATANKPVRSGCGQPATGPLALQASCRLDQFFLTIDSAGNLIAVAAAPGDGWNRNQQHRSAWVHLHPLSPNTWLSAYAAIASSGADTAVGEGAQALGRNGYGAGALRPGAQPPSGCRRIGNGRRLGSLVRKPARLVASIIESVKTAANADTELGAVASGLAPSRHRQRCLFDGYRIGRNGLSAVAARDCLQRSVAALATAQRQQPSAGAQEAVAERAAETALSVISWHRACARPQWVRLPINQVN